MSLGVLPNQLTFHSDSLTPVPSKLSQNTPRVYPVTPKGRAGHPSSSTGGGVVVGSGGRGVAVGGVVGVGPTGVAVARSGNCVAVGLAVAVAVGVLVLVAVGVRVGVGVSLGVTLGRGVRVGVVVLVTVAGAVSVTAFVLVAGAVFTGVLACAVRVASATAVRAVLSSSGAPAANSWRKIASTTPPVVISPISHPHRLRGLRFFSCGLIACFIFTPIGWNHPVCLERGRTTPVARVFIEHGPGVVARDQLTP